MSAFVTADAPRETTSDGRHARRARNRDAVVDAVVEFLREGELRPTAQMVAERSGVSLRSVFRYFPDLRALQLAAIERYAEVFGATQFTPPPPGASLDERIDRWVDHRLARHRDHNVLLVGLTQAARQIDEVIDALEAVRREVCRHLVALFRPEIESVPEPERAVMAAALHSATLAETIVNLGERHGLDQAEQRAALRALMTGALAGCRP